MTCRRRMITSSQAEPTIRSTRKKASRTNCFISPMTNSPLVVMGSRFLALGRFILDQRQTTKDRGKRLRTLGTVNLAEKLRFVEEGKVTAPTKQRNKRKQVPCQSLMILGATVSGEAGRWYVSIQVEIKRPLPPPRQPVVGVDVGLKQSAVVSDGRRTQNQRPLALHLRKLGKLQRQLGKKQKTKDSETKRTVFSKNYLKQREKVARKHQQIANIRRDVQHKFTTELAQTCGTIGIGRPQYPGDDAESESGQSGRGCGDGATVAVPQNQGRQCGRGSLYRLALVSFHQTLFLLWACQKTHAPQASQLSVSGLWNGHRPGSERRLEPGLVRNGNASPTSGVKLAVLGSGYDRTINVCGVGVRPKREG